MLQALRCKFTELHLQVNAAMIIGLTAKTATSANRLFKSFMSSSLLVGNKEANTKPTGNNLFSESPKTVKKLIPFLSFYILKQQNRPTSERRLCLRYINKIIRPLR